MKKIKKNIVLLSGILITILLLELFVTRTYSTIFINSRIKVSQFKQLRESVEYFVKDYSGFVSVYIKDLTDGRTVLINENKKIPAASIIKIPIMTAVYYLNEKGLISLDEELVYEKRHRCGGSGKIKFLPYKTKFKLKDLVEVMITESDNIATNIITEKIGLVTLNNIFKETFGLKDTDMNRYIMNLKLRDRGVENYTTAKEIGLMLENIYQGRRRLCP
ncbi:MAG: serine hydrolase, partial [Endomicrobiia bacterium]